jgi:hypothetical protein
MPKEIDYIPTKEQVEEQELDPIGIETRIKELEHTEFLAMKPIYIIRHEKEQLKRDLSIARAKYWRGKSS